MPKYNFPRFSQKHIKDCKLIYKLQHRYILRDYPDNQFGVADKFLLNLVIREQAEIFKKYYSINQPLIIASDQTQAILRRMKEFGYHPKIHNYSNKP